MTVVALLLWITTVTNAPAHTAIRRLFVIVPRIVLSQVPAARFIP
jgi:hypothetical protein